MKRIENYEYNLELETFLLNFLTIAYKIVIIKI